MSLVKFLKKEKRLAFFFSSGGNVLKQQI